MTPDEHLQRAEAFARSLSVDQGQVMRALIYHCTAAAIVGAIDDHKNATKR
jgi:hypothetical protein